MLRWSRPRMLAATVALSLSIVACGGGEDQSTTESKPEGRTVAGTGYEIALPDGWSRMGSSAGEEVRLVVGEGERQTAAVTVSRITDPPQGMALPELAEAIRQRLLSNVPGLTAADLGRPEPFSLAGTDALVYKARASAERKEATIRGLVTLRDGVEYTVIFAAALGESKGPLAGYETMLESWEWKPVKASAPSAVPPVDEGARPARGEPVAGDGYQLNLPRGWRTLSTEPPPGLDPPEGYIPPDMLAAGDTIDGTAVTASVVVDPAPGMSLDDYVSERGKRIFGEDPTLTKVSLAGAPAVVAEQDHTVANGKALRSTIVLALDGGTAYGLRFSAPRGSFEAQSPAFRSALASWRWQ